MILPTRSGSVKLGAAIAVAFVGIAWPVCAAIGQGPAAGPGKVVAIGGGRKPSATTGVSVPPRERESRPEDETQDPFRPFDAETAPAPKAVTQPEPTAAVPPTLAGPLLPAATAAVASTKDAGAVKAPSVSAPAPLRLTGVVVGDQPTAVVAVGEGEIVVRPGDVLPDGSTLVQVERTHATFVRQGRKTVLWIAD